MINTNCTTYWLEPRRAFGFPRHTGIGENKILEVVDTVQFWLYQFSGILCSVCEVVATAEGWKGCQRARGAGWGQLKPFQVYYVSTAASVVTYARMARTNTRVRYTIFLKRNFHHLSFSNGYYNFFIGF